ncbi:MAG: hypothetical protein U0269_28600 [Polyangiales bacterium]
MKTKITLGSMTLFFALAACSPPVNNNPDATAGDAANNGDASASGIGPAGGIVRDPAGLTAVSVPAGALSTTVALTLEPTVDETPLPSGAIRVGYQFKLGPTGTTFAQPVRWTLPYDPVDVATLGNSQSDVKVWVRTAAGWTLTEPVEVTGASVTIEVRKATIAAAGVRFRPLGRACGGAGQPACTMPMTVSPEATCTGAFCLQVIAEPAGTAPRILHSGHITVQDGKVYWFAGVVKRANLTGGTVSTSSPSSGLTFGGLDIGRSIAIDRDGNAWAGLFRYSFAAGATTETANVPPGFGRNSVVDINPDGRADAPELVRAQDGSIHAYRRLVRQVGEGSSLTVSDVRMERWTFNPDRSVSGPVTISQAVGPNLVIRQDPMTPGAVWLLGRFKPSAALGLTTTNEAADGARLLHVDSAGTVLASLTAPVEPNSLSQSSTNNTTGLCDATCSVLHNFSLSVRATELIAPTRPAITNVTTVQRMDGASASLTRTQVNLPMAIDPIIEVVHDSTGGLWLFTRSPSQQQVWHFDRAMNRLSPIGLGDRAPFGITSDGGDGVLVMVNGAEGGNPTGIVRIRRLMM